MHLRKRRVCHQRGDTCRRRADDAKQRAAQATDPVIKNAYEKVAEYWMLLAQLDSLLGDEKNNEDAYQARTLKGEVAITVA